MERAVARIDFDAVRANCARLKAALGDGAELCAVIKADGYGHGADGCAAAAIEGGATRLAVATAGEAEQIGRRFQQMPLLTMGLLTVGEVDAVISAGSELAVWDEGFRQLIAARARAHGHRARIHVKYDSGMGRLGSRDQGEVLELARACAEDPDLELAGVWTHFATADELDSAFFDEQLDRFDEVAAAIRSEHPGVLVHAANSAAVLRDRRSHYDMARCGVAIYGLDPFQRDPAEQGLRPALSLHSQVGAVKRFPAGASAGYGRRWAAEVDTWVGVVPLGYGDGVRRGLGNNAEVLVGGRRYPLVGTVSMDNVTVDLGPETSVRPGDEAVLIGRQGEEAILAEEVAARLETINYEVTCAISARVPRHPA
ncbi:MAG TPA: alanine racemase [Solirubrobacterales bacterium]|nr:alanine racemase [Solirubrobacterales bacterium]